MSDTNALQKIDEPQGELPVIVNAPITPAQGRVDAVANLTMKAYERASTLVLTPEEITALQADFPDEAFRPGAAGNENLIYIEHAYLRDRMNQVIGVGQWTMIPRSRWAEAFTTKKGTEGSRVYVEAMLVVRGCFVSEAVGAMEYYPKNDSQNYSDAVEGAKTAAFRRCAKELGVGLQAWKKDWCEGWWQRRNAKTKKGTVPYGTHTTSPTPATPSTAKPAGSAPAASAVPTAPTPAAPPAQVATEKHKDRWLALLKPLGFDAVLYARDKGWIMPPADENDPGEPLEAMSLTWVPTTKEQADAIMADIQARMDGPAPAENPSTKTQFEADMDAVEPPGGWQGAAGGSEPEQDDGTETLTGKLESVSEKSGSSKKGAWTRYGLKFGNLWISTFDKKMGELAKKDKGHACRVQYRKTERGCDLVSIERA